MAAATVDMVRIASPDGSHWSSPPAADAAAPEIAPGVEVAGTRPAGASAGERALAATPSASADPSSRASASRSVAAQPGSRTTGPGVASSAGTVRRSTEAARPSRPVVDPVSPQPAPGPTTAAPSPAAGGSGQVSTETPGSNTMVQVTVSGVTETTDTVRAILRKATHGGGTAGSSLLSQAAPGTAE